MLPTLAVGGEIAIEDRLTYRFFPQHLGRGDLITLKSPLEPGRVICKRVLGLPGDVICVDPTGEYAPSTEHVVVPKGHVWISGDNAAYSRDSRQYGPVSISLIHGRLLAKVSSVTLVCSDVLNVCISGLATTRCHDFSLANNYFGLNGLLGKCASSIKLLSFLRSRG
jgi:inner membrane protease subunit 1